jgi:Transposase DDE domain
LRIEGNGLPLTFLWTVGERHEGVVIEALMEPGAVPRLGGGRPRLRPQRLVADKSYRSGKIRRYLRRRGIRYSIPGKENEKHRGKFDKAVYRQRNLVLTVSNNFVGLPRDMRRMEQTT